MSGVNWNYFRISFICKFRPCIPGVPCSTDDDDDDDDEEEPEEEDHEEDGEDEMYSMSVRLAGEVEKSLLKRRSDSAPVAIGDDIHVSSHINAVPYLALAMEHCWLSSSPRPTSFAGPRDVKLITSGCPARENVSMQWEEGSSNSAFTFTLSPSLSHHQRLWIQCRMGLCSATSSGANGNILRYCSLLSYVINPISAGVLGQKKLAVLARPPTWRAPCSKLRCAGPCTSYPCHGTS